MRSWLLVVVLGWSGVAGGDELHLIVSGKAVHFKEGNYNENNWGVGFEYDFAPRGRWIPFVTGASFLDSNKDVSSYLGGGTKHRHDLGDGWHLDAGVFAFLMTRKDYRNNRPFPGFLPFVSIGTERAALNITYVPRVQQKTTPLIYFQLMFRLARFD